MFRKGVSGTLNLDVCGVSFRCVRGNLEVSTRDIFGSTPPGLPRGWGSFVSPVGEDSSPDFLSY